ncbi:MAG TPA: hypothetical protein PLZ45_11695 [Ferruginibacter sp.]|nr:hypothetical protein [Ferruginibacter sp.]
MSRFSLNPDMNIEVMARFIAKGSDAPLTGADYELRLFEKDLMEDDFLGRSALDGNGTAKVIFRHGDYMDFLNPEKEPDLYFALYRGEALIFQSKVIRDIDIAGLEKFEMGSGEVVDLGTFLVDV